MKKYIILIGLPLMFACKGGNKEVVSDRTNVNADSLNTLNSELSGQLEGKEATINGFLKSFNEIQENLNAIKSKQKTVLAQTEGVETKKSRHEQIISDIQFINDLLDQNRKTLNSLTEKLRTTDLKNDELNKTISHLNTQVNEKEQEIDFLKTRLSSLNIKLNETDEAYQKARKESLAKTEALNTAYCSIGTAADLAKQGVVTKQGGFIGVGKLKELDPNVAKGMFSPVDIYQTKEISIAAKSVKIITEHTKGSYKLDNTYHLKTLTILNPDEFWKTSRYLVIEISSVEPTRE